MLDAAREAQQGLLERELHVRVEVVAAPLEARVGLLLQRHDHVARDLARPLLGHAREAQLRARAHAPLDVRLEDRLLVLALLLRVHLLLLLHDHARPHLALDHAHLVRAAAAARALAVAPPGALAADDAPRDRRVHDVAQVHVLEGHGQLHARVGPALAAAARPPAAAPEEHRERVHAAAAAPLVLLDSLLDALEAARVVQDALVLVAQDLVGERHAVHELRAVLGGRRAVGLRDLDLLLALVGVVPERQLPVRLLDLLLVDLVVQPQDLVQVQVLVALLLAQERRRALLAVLHALALEPRVGGRLHLRGPQLVQARLAPPDVDRRLVRRPLALALLAVRRRRLEAAVGAEAHVAPRVPVPARRLEPVEVVVDAARRARAARRAAAAAAHAVHLLEHALRDLELELRPRARHDGEAARRRRPQAGPAPRHFGFRVGVRPAEGCNAMRQGLRFGFRVACVRRRAAALCGRVDLAFAQACVPLRAEGVRGECCAAEAYAS